MDPVLFFDLDGTLSDTHDLARATWLETLRPYGIDVDARFYQDNMRGRSNPDVFQELLPDWPAHEREALRERHDHAYRDRVHRAAPFPGVTQFMQAAHERGWRLALVTNTPKADAPKSLEPLGLSDMFDTQAFAEDAGAHKPDPAAYRLALDALDTTPEHGVAFEDSPKGVTAAVGAGLSVIGLVTTHHPAELRDAGAALVIGDFADRALYDVLDRPDMLRGA